MLLFLDLETTGFDNKKDNILEISAVRYDEDKKEIVAKFDRILNLPEGIEVSPMIEGLTGISTEMCRNEGISLSQAQKEFSEFIKKDDIITGHNIFFDTGFLNQFGFLDFETYRHKEIDTFILSVLVLGQEEESHALEILSEKYGIVHKNAHRAMSDVLANLDFYKILEKIYARNFSENFQKFLNTYHFTFDEKYFFNAVEKNKEHLKKESLPSVSPFVRSSVGQTSEKTDFFVEKFSQNKSLFFQSFNARKYVSSLLESAKISGKNISFFYPNKENKEFYNLYLQVSQEKEKENAECSSFQFFSDPKKLVCPQKFQKFLEKGVRNGFDKFESIVATKVFRAKELHQEIFIRFMGEEWAPARTILGKKREDLSMFSAKILPLSEAKYQKNSDEIRVFFGGENLEDQLLEMQQNKLFSKRILEDFSDSIDKKDKISDVLSTLANALRKEKGENQYSVAIQWKDLEKMKCRLGAIESFEGFLETDFEACNEIQKSHILTWIAFLDTPQENEIKILELYPDNRLSIETINPFFEESFQKMCSTNNSTFFFGKSFPKDFSQTLSLSFSGENPEILDQFSFESDKKYCSKEVFCPEFSRDATPQEIANIVIQNIESEHPDNFIISLTSKKNIGEVRNFLRAIAEEKGIKIFSHESGGRGKIKKLMQKFPKKIVIGNTKFLAGLDLSPLDFSALFVHKVQFDHPKQPLVQAQRKRFQNDFEQYSLPRAIGRLEQDVFQFSETPQGENIKLYLGEGRIYDSSTFYSKFQNIFPENTLFKAWRESVIK